MRSILPGPRPGPVPRCRSGTPRHGHGGPGILRRSGWPRREARVGAARDGSHAHPSPAGKVSGVAAALPPSNSYFRLSGSQPLRDRRRGEPGPGLRADRDRPPVRGPRRGRLAGRDRLRRLRHRLPRRPGRRPAGLGPRPLLLVPPTGTVPAAVKTELNRIKPRHRHLRWHRGGQQQRRHPARGLRRAISRIAGTNRYDTAAQTALQNDYILRQQDTDDDGTPTTSAPSSSSWRPAKASPTHSPAVVRRPTAGGRCCSRPRAPCPARPAPRCRRSSPRRSSSSVAPAW